MEDSEPMSLSEGREGDRSASNESSETAASVSDQERPIAKFWNVELKGVNAVLFNSGFYEIVEKVKDTFEGILC